MSETLQGIQFPITDAKKGKRSTTTAGKTILAAALGDNHNSALKGESDRKWRWGYQKWIIKTVSLMASCSTADLKTMASSGLQTAQDYMEFHRKGEFCSMSQAMQPGKFTGTFATGTVHGEGPAVDAAAHSASFKGKDYGGQDLVSLLETWAESGNMHPSAATSVRAALANEQWLDLKNETFVLIGATSEMGPLQFLLERGATVVALARNNPKKPERWLRIMSMAKDTCGKLLFPLSEEQDGNMPLEDLAQRAGADVLVQTPELANWLVSVLPSNRPAHIGSYIYLDGEAHVRAAIAMDALVNAVLTRRSQPTSLCFLATPSHCHVVPRRCEALSQMYAKKAPLWQQGLAAVNFLNPLSFVNAQEGSVTLGGDKPVILNALVGVQGPNYAIAKILQRWRQCLHKLNGGCVSVNVAPPAATKSVMHVKKVAFAMKNIHNFEPNMLFPPELVRLVMALLLTKDLKDSKSMSQPSSSAHPLELVAHQAWHGGNWTCAYSGDSTGKGAFIVGLYKKNKVVILVVLALLSLLVLYRFM